MLMPGVKCIYKDEKNDIELLLGPDKKSDADLFVNKLAWVASVYKIKPSAASKVLQRYMNNDINIHVGKKYEDKVNFRKSGAASDALRLPGAMILLISMKDTKVSNAHREMMANLLIDNSVSSIDQAKLRSTWNTFKDTAGYVISVSEQIGHNWFHTTKDSDGTDYFHMFEFIAVVKQVIFSIVYVIDVLFYLQICCRLNLLFCFIYHNLHWDIFVKKNQLFVHEYFSFVTIFIFMC